MVRPCAPPVPADFAGMSKILDSESERRKPVKGPHGEVVGAVVGESELVGKVLREKKEREEQKRFWSSLWLCSALPL